MTQVSVEVSDENHAQSALAFIYQVGLSLLRLDPLFTYDLGGAFAPSGFHAQEIQLPGSTSDLLSSQEDFSWLVL